MSKKTNIEHLRDLIKDNNEAIEFLDAIQEELENEKAASDNFKDEVRYLESAKNELENEISYLKEEMECNNFIKTPQGIIKWEADNLQHIAILEALSEKINSKSPIEIEAAINAL